MRVDPDDVGKFLKLMGRRRAVLNVRELKDKGKRGRGGKGEFLCYMKMERKSHVFVGVFNRQELYALSGIGVGVYDIDRLQMLF